MRRNDPRAGFTTLGVPLFFCLLYVTAVLVGLPLALLAAPAIFGLALVIVPPPSRLTLPTCARLARREAKRACRQAAGLAEQSPPPAPVFDSDRGGVEWKGRYLMPDPDRSVYVSAIPPVAPASQPRLAA